MASRTGFTAEPRSQRTPGGVAVSAGPPNPQRPVLYDADCGFCKWSLNKVLAWDRRQRLRPIAIQSEEGQALLADVPEAQRLDSWHVVLPSGEVRSGGAAAEPLAQSLPGGRPLAFLFRTFPRVTDRIYRFVADNRNRFARRLGIDASCRVRR
jgi:predicted DCC family thiol-disulfide oxidoreductase YuxK